MTVVQNNPEVRVLGKPQNFSPPCCWFPLSRQKTILEYSFKFLRVSAHGQGIPIEAAMESKRFRYVSTRASKSDSMTYSFQDVLLKGFAPDGGLFVPVEIPKLTEAILQEWSRLTYPQLVVAIAELFISPEEIPRIKLSQLIQDALGSFRSSNVIETHHLTAPGHASVIELFHGLTLAFKDLAMTCTAKFLEYFLAQSQQHMNIIVSTSGDTGAAAMSAFRDSPHVDFFVLYPLGRVTEFQELQMTALAATAKNLHLFGINGTSDDGDDIMLDLFNDSAFAQGHNLSSVNSVNWSRILIQIAHHFFAYFQVHRDGERAPVEIVCPSGAAGNLSAGLFAREMGLPIRLVACVNENEFVHRLLSTGVVQTDATVKQTLASAMDIQMAYNMERILAKNGTNFPQNCSQKLSEVFVSSKTTDAEIRAAMKRCWDEEQYRVCPHTATAIHYHYKQTAVAGGEDTRRACLATASPIKFPEALTEAGVPLPDMTILVELRAKPHKVVQLKDKNSWIPSVRAAIELVSK
ncbi:Threonine synthase-like 2 [Hypsibius exemplaris]|uniref:Threonine synthase-like 2 n=1 Tax=Hypsibius exemplaris TaxID=2072580 RepID=A0A1W0WKQ2_HYPEX|nr:Threonine synthase-like 2 [Hypsibius exemplaris]